MFESVRARAGGLTLTHLRGSSDYRSCQHLAQRSVLTQMNGSPKTSVNTAVNTVLTHPPGKTRVYLQKPGYTREIPGSASMPPAPYSQGPCANCGAHRLLKYAHRTSSLQVLKAASALCARHGLQVWRCGRCGRADIKRHPGPGAPQASRPAGGAAGRPRCARRWRCTP